MLFLRTELKPEPKQIIKVPSPALKEAKKSSVLPFFCFFEKKQAKSGKLELIGEEKEWNSVVNKNEDRTP